MFEIPTRRYLDEESSFAFDVSLVMCDLVSCYKLASTYCVGFSRSVMDVNHVYRCFFSEPENRCFRLVLNSPLRLAAMRGSAVTVQRLLEASREIVATKDKNRKYLIATRIYVSVDRTTKMS